MPDFDLVDQMQWEDLVVFLSLEDAGLENPREFDTVPAAQSQYFNEEN